MAYTPHEWSNGETITAAKLNNIEEGIEEAAQSGGGGVMIVTSSLVNGVNTMDKTVREIHDALMSGTPVYYKYSYGTFGETYVYHFWLAPITYVFVYEQTDFVRVVVQRPIRGEATATGSISSLGSFVPSVMTFQASSLDSYPTYYRTVQPTGAASLSTESFFIT